MILILDDRTERNNDERNNDIFLKMYLGVIGLMVKNITYKKYVVVLYVSNVDIGR